MSKRKQPKSDSAEPYLYIGLVLKGTEKQYLNLLKYVNGRNGSQVIYQCKSLTYLRINKADCTRLRAVTNVSPIEIDTEGGET